MHLERAIFETRNIPTLWIGGRAARCLSGGLSDE